MTRAVKFVVGAGMAFGLAAAAMADLGGPVLRITAVANSPEGQITGVLDITEADGAWNGDQFVANVGNRNFRDAGGNVVNSLGMLENAQIVLFQDPVVTANFNVQGGFFNTTYSISSAILSFPAMTGATGHATAAVSVTDIDGDGVVASPTIGSNLYRAYYNNLSSPTLFGALLGATGNVTPFGSATSNGDTGVFAIPGTVSDIQAVFDFSVSAFDLASGTSTFTVVPAPGAAGLIGVAGLVALRRRR